MADKKIILELDIKVEAARKHVDELNKAIEKSNEVTKQLLKEKGKENAEYQKSAKSLQDMKQQQKDATKVLREQERERLKAIKAVERQRAKWQDIIKASQMEARTNDELRQKLNALIAIRDKTTIKGSAAYNKLTGSIQKLDKEVKANNASIGRHQGNVGNYPQIMAGAVAAAGALIMAFRQISRVVKESIDAFLVQEDISLKVSNTFGEYSKQINDAADATQALTRVGNEQYQKLAVLASNMGVANGQVNQTVQDSIGLAELFAASGLSQETAMKGLALARQGDYTQLQRYIPALKDANTEAEKQAILNDITAKGFDLAQKNAASYQGRLTQMKNAYGDLQEVVGGQILGGIFDPKEGNQIVDIINRVTEALEKTKFVSTLLKTIGALLAPIGRAFKNIFNIIAGGESDANTLEDSLNGINKTVKILLAPLTALTKSMEWLTKQVKKLGINFVPLLAALGVYAARVKIIAITTKIASAAKAAYAVVTGVLTGKIKLAEIAQKKMNAATKANIYVAMASAAVALGVALYKVYQNSDKVAALQKDINKAYEEATKSIGNQKAELNSLLTTAKNHNLSLTDRKAAIKKINEISPEYLGNITFENLYTTETATAINNYNKALQNKAKQQALLSITSEKYAKVLELQYEREQLGTGRYANKKYNDLTTEINALNDEILQVETSFQKLFATETPTNKIEPAIQSVIDKIDELWNEAALGDADALIELNNIMGTSYDKVALSTVGAADAIQAYKQSLIDASKESNKKLEEGKEAEAIDAANKAYQSWQNTLKSIRDELDFQLYFAKTTDESNKAIYESMKKNFDATKQFFASGGYTGDELARLKELENEMLVFQGMIIQNAEDIFEIDQKALDAKLNDIDAELEAKIAADTKWIEDKIATDEAELLAEEEKQKKKQEIVQQYYEKYSSIAQGFTEQVTGMLQNSIDETGFSMQKFGQQFSLFILDLLEKQVTASIASATAQSFAQPDSVATAGISGGIRAGILAGLIKGAFTVVKSIISQPSKFESGGLLSGARHSQGGITIEAEDGEAIINRNATAQYLPILSAINQSTGGVPLMENGGVAGFSSTGTATTNINPFKDVKIVATIEDINAGLSKESQRMSIANSI